MGRISLGLVLLLAGCDTLFPEFSHPPPDQGGMSSGDGGPPAAPHIAGQVCSLLDVRDYRSCTLAAAAPFRITVEETRDAVMSDSAGIFTLTTSRPLTVATLAAVDPAGNYATTVTVLQLANGVLDRIVIPVLSAARQRDLSNFNGIPLDPTRGSLLVYAIDAMGAPVAGVSTPPPNLAVGPYYDGPGSGELSLGGATHTHGLVALFNLSAPTLDLLLKPPAPYRADHYELQIRPNAVTISALPLH